MIIHPLKLISRSSCSTKTPNDKVSFMSSISMNFEVSMITPHRTSLKISLLSKVFSGQPLTMPFRSRHPMTISLFSAKVSTNLRASLTTTTTPLKRAEKNRAKIKYTQKTIGKRKSSAWKTWKSKTVTLSPKLTTSPSVLNKLNSNSTNWNITTHLTIRIFT